MKGEEEKIHQIIEYIYNDMSVEDRKIFEKRLDEDPWLMDQYKRHLAMVENLKISSVLDEIENDPFKDEAHLLAEEALEKHRVSTTEESVVQDHPARNIIKILPWLALAAVLLIGLFIKPLFQPTGDKLFNRFYEPFYSASFTYRGTDDTRKKVEGIQSYMNKDFKASIKIFQDLKEDEIFTAETSFFLGLSYLAEGDYKKAEITFREHLDTYSGLDPEVKWYLGLTYLKLGEDDKAKRLFEELSDFPGSFGKKARRITKILSKE